MLIIKNGKIVTMTGAPIDGGEILVDRGRIVAINDRSDTVPRPVDIVIDAEYNYVFPGFIDMHTHCGLDGLYTGDLYRDELFIAPYVKTSAYINPDSDDFRDKRMSGITSVMVTPFDERIVGGKCCLIKTFSDGGLNILSDDCGTFFSLRGMGEGTCRVYPDTVPDFIREDLHSASGYLSSDENSLDSPSLAAYGPVLSGTTHAFFSVSDSEQLKTAESITNAFSLDSVMILNSRTERIPDTPFIIDPMQYGTDALKKTADDILSCDTDFAITGSGYGILSVNAGLFVRAGLDMESGFEAITTSPASICGMSDRIGALKEGMDADIVIWRGNPLEVLSEVLYTIIDGKVAYSSVDE